jgi:hypothetical protein
MIAVAQPSCVLGVAGIRPDVLADEVVTDPVVGMVLVGMGTSLAEQILVVGAGQGKPAGAIQESCCHVIRPSVMFKRCFEQSRSAQTIVK